MGKEEEVTGLTTTSPPHALHSITWNVFEGPRAGISLMKGLENPHREADAE
jgi:hypothetical protein